MRQFIGGDGTDTTAAVLAYLPGARQLYLADLYLIGELEESSALFLTNWNSPLSWPVWGTFQPATLNRGKVTSAVGLTVASLNLTWSPPVGIFTQNVSTTSPYQLAQNGFYDNKKVRLWRCVMPTSGDANTFGACEWFGGWIADTVAERGAIKFTINSFLDVTNQKLPPNVIEATNTLAAFAGATPVLVDGETAIPRFTVKAPSSQTVILGDAISPTAHKIYGNNKFRYGYMVFEPGTTLAGFWSAIAQNLNFNAGGGIHYNEFDIYSPFPWAPTPGDTFYASTQPPINLQDGTPSFPYIGFPFVPDPATAF